MSPIMLYINHSTFLRQPTGHSHRCILNTVAPKPELEINAPHIYVRQTVPNMRLIVFLWPGEVEIVTLQPLQCLTALDRQYELVSAYSLARIC
jgi:hypothetical protein